MLNVKYTDSAQFRCLEHLKQTSIDLYLVHCGYEKCKASHVCAGSREEYIIHFILEGKGTFSANGRTWKLTPGQMFLIHPGDPVTYASDEENPWVYAWVGFNGIRAEAILRNCGFSERTLVRSFTNADRIQQHIRNILSVRQLTMANDLRRQAQLFCLLADLMDEYTKSQKHESGVKAVHDYSTNVYLEHAIEYIKNFYQQGINVSDVMEYIGLSRTYLNQIFRKELGISVQKFLMDFRLHKAANLLMSTSKSVGEIASDVGYGDALAFSKVFKKKFGMSPKNYRESRNSKEEMDKFTEKQ